MEILLLLEQKKAMQSRPKIHLVLYPLSRLAAQGRGGTGRLLFTHYTLSLQLFSTFTARCDFSPQSRSSDFSLINLSSVLLKSCGMNISFKTWAFRSADHSRKNCLLLFVKRLWGLLTLGLHSYISFSTGPLMGLCVLSFTLFTCFDFAKEEVTWVSAHKLFMWGKYVCVWERESVSDELIHGSPLPSGRPGRSGKNW